MSVPIPGKSSWPELVGVQATLAATAIAHDRPDVAVEVLPPHYYRIAILSRFVTTFCPGFSTGTIHPGQM